MLQQEICTQLDELLTDQLELEIEDKDDEGSIEKQIRERTQELLQKQQDLMTAQACLDKARQAEAEASEAWQAKRYTALRLQRCSSLSICWCVPFCLLGTSLC